MNNKASAMTKLTGTNKKNKAYTGLARSLVISAKNNIITEKNMGTKVSGADINVAGKGDIVQNLLVTQTGEDKVLSAINNLIDQYPSYTQAASQLTDISSSTISSDNNNNYVYATLPSETATVSAGFAASDPSQPDNVEDKLAYLYSRKSTEDTVPAFNINSLYHSDNNINLNNNTYKNKNTGEDISNETVLYASAAGIITEKDSPMGLPIYRLVSSSELEQTTNDDSNKMTPFMFQDNTVGQETLHYRTVKSNVQTTQQTKYRYNIGFDNIKLAKKSVKDIGGYLSRDIVLGSCGYFTLSCDTYQGVEFYIVDGKAETPILPVQQATVENEKLFFGLMPRFEISNPDNIVVKKNGVITDITTLESLRLFLTANTGDIRDESFYDTVNLYTISYTPKESAHEYVPKSKSIKLKIISRKGIGIPQIVKAVTLNKYGTNIDWYLSSIDSSKHYNPNDLRNR